jgi:small subunit ribosomal protein S7
MEVKVFNKWDVNGITVEDLGLKNYICLKPTFVPRTGARYAKFRFKKSDVFIVERFMNKLMVPGHKSKKHKISSYKMSGKGTTAYNIMRRTLELIEQRTKKNPIEVLVKAVENAAPREEIITIEYGGAKYPKAVECAPQRRVDQAIKYMTQGSYQKSFNSKRGIVETLATEILNAYGLSGQSAAIAKKLELERQADSSR